MTDQILANLRSSYDASAEARNAAGRSAWKMREQAVFVDLMQRENRHSLLELGAGPGIDAAAFQERGLKVSAVDNSPEMVRFCREKGVDAQVMDLMQLTFPSAEFDAVYAMNSLLHVPHAHFEQTLAGIGRVLKPGGLFFLGQHGGIEFEGVWPDDAHDLKRFFAFFTDEQLLAKVASHFQIEQFRKIFQPDSIRSKGMRFQLIICRKALASA